MHSVTRAAIAPTAARSGANAKPTTPIVNGSSTKLLPSLFLNQIIELNMRIELLSKRTKREKLLAYFTIISTRNISKSFTIPFSLTDLADYLSIDRSAMMREMKLLKEEGFIKKTGNKFTLLIQ